MKRLKYINKIDDCLSKLRDTPEYDNELYIELCDTQYDYITEMIKPYSIAIQMIEYIRDISESGNVCEECDTKKMANKVAKILTKILGNDAISELTVNGKEVDLTVYGMYCPGWDVFEDEWGKNKIM